MIAFVQPLLPSKKSERSVAPIRFFEGRGGCTQAKNERQWKKAKSNTSNEIFSEHNDIFSIKRVTRKFHIATTAKKCTKKWLGVFRQLDLLIFFAFLFAVAV